MSGYQPAGARPDRPDYATYRSPHGPKYSIGRNLYGFNAQSLMRIGKGGALFAGVAAIAGSFFLSDVPRFRIDIMQKIPFIGHRYVKEIPPEDDPF